MEKMALLDRQHERGTVRPSSPFTLLSSSSLPLASPVTCWLLAAKGGTPAALPPARHTTNHRSPPSPQPILQASGRQREIPHPKTLTLIVGAALIRHSVRRRDGDAPTAARHRLHRPRPPSPPPSPAPSPLALPESNSDRAESVVPGRRKGSRNDR
jgi:hypothetical protein